MNDKSLINESGYVEHVVMFMIKNEKHNLMQACNFNLKEVHSHCTIAQFQFVFTESFFFVRHPFLYLI